MTRDQMLDLLHEHGEDAGSDYNDGDEVEGWFGWKVNGEILTVKYQPCTDDGRAGAAQMASWRLVPVEAAP